MGRRCSKRPTATSEWDETSIQHLASHRSEAMRIAGHFATASWKPAVAAASAAFHATEQRRAVRPSDLPCRAIPRRGNAGGESAPGRRRRSTKLRRQRDLAFYMGYCPDRRKGHVSCGTRDGRALSRTRRLDRHACSSSRTGVWAGAGPDVRVSCAAIVCTLTRARSLPRERASASVRLRASGVAPAERRAAVVATEGSGEVDGVGVPDPPPDLRDGEIGFDQ